MKWTTKQTLKELLGWTIFAVSYAIINLSISIIIVYFLVNKR